MINEAATALKLLIPYSHPNTVVVTVVQLVTTLVTVVYHVLVDVLYVVW
jgi:hypothetical protein